MSETTPDFDAIVLLSFGGPEAPEEVMPFLRHVVAGRNVPDARLEIVAKHYYALGGKSPINEQNRALIGTLEAELDERPVSENKLPIYFANRHAAPFFEDTFKQMADNGVKRVVALVTSAFSSYSGCRQYREAVTRALHKLDLEMDVHFVRRYFNHPGFLNALADQVATAVSHLGGNTRIAFTAHSIPVVMAKGCDYEEQLLDACEVIAKAVGVDQWQLVYQSRSGPPQVPWLEPDILDHIEALSQIGTERLVIAPIGFVSDHMEVIWDLDHEAADLCKERGIDMVRAKTVGTHPTFVSGLRDLIAEITKGQKPLTLGTLPPRVTPCAVDCCPRGASGRPGRPSGGGSPAGQRPS